MRGVAPVSKTGARVSNVFENHFDVARLRVVRTT